MGYNFVDMIIAVSLLAAFFYGFRRGLVMGLFELAGLILSFFVSYNYSYMMQDILMSSTGTFGYVKESVAERLAQIFESQSTVDVGGIFKGFDKLPFDIQKLLNDFIFKDAINEAVTQYIDTLADRIATIFIFIISFAITFLIVYFILMIAANILNTMFKAPILSTFNKIFGGGLGILKSVVMIYIIFAIASPFISMSKPDNSFTTMILESRSSEVFYENNLILNYLTYKGILSQ